MGREYKSSKTMVETRGRLKRGGGRGRRYDTRMVGEEEGATATQDALETRLCDDAKKKNDPRCHYSVYDAPRPMQWTINLFISSII